MSSPLAFRAARKSVGVGNATGSTPKTPRARFVHTITPENSPSTSASTPFDWNATKGKTPLNFQTPLRVKQLRNGENPRPSTPRRVIRKKSLKEKFVRVVSPVAWSHCSKGSKQFLQISCFKSPSFLTTYLYPNPKLEPGLLVDSCISCISVFAYRLQGRQ